VPTLALTGILPLTRPWSEVAMLSWGLHTWRLAIYQNMTSGALGEAYANRSPAKNGIHGRDAGNDIEELTRKLTAATLAAEQMFGENCRLQVGKSKIEKACGAALAELRGVDCGKGFLECQERILRMLQDSVPGLEPL
jgi:hypothetical protein